MRLFPLTLLLIAMTIPTQSTSANDQLLYLASTADKTIVAYNIDDDSGLLTKKFSVDLPGNGGSMAFSPDKTFVYASVTGLEGNAAGVSTFRRSKDGTLTLIDTA